MFKAILYQKQYTVINNKQKNQQFAFYGARQVQEEGIPVQQHPGTAGQWFPASSKPKGRHKKRETDSKKPVSREGEVPD
jgi:hypothetical protein